jgi:hypothetical protein
MVNQCGNYSSPPTQKSNQVEIISHVYLLFCFSRKLCEIVFSSPHYFKALGVITICHIRDASAARLGGRASRTDRAARRSVGAVSAQRVRSRLQLMMMQSIVDGFIYLNNIEDIYLGLHVSSGDDLDSVCRRVCSQLMVSRFLLCFADLLASFLVWFLSRSFLTIYRSVRGRFGVHEMLKVLERQRAIDVSIYDVTGKSPLTDVSVRIVLC